MKPNHLPESKLVCDKLKFFPVLISIACYSKRWTSGLGTDSISVTRSNNATEGKGDKMDLNYNLKTKWEPWSSILVALFSLWRLNTEWLLWLWSHEMVSGGFNGGFQWGRSVGHGWDVSPTNVSPSLDPPIAEFCFWPQKQHSALGRSSD